MSTIPKSRSELELALERAFESLQQELDALGPGVGGKLCVDDWSVKDLLAVRVWWSESVADWVEAGLRGEEPTMPAPGYRWSETPKLNDATVRAERRTSLRKLRERLRQAYVRVRALIDRMSDEELLDPERARWVGGYSVARLIAMNTTRQYKTARTYIRKVTRSQG